MKTTRKKAGSAAAFDKIDREYVVNAARAAKSDDSSLPQRLLYVSVGGANPNSWESYWRSKGITEQKLAELGYNDTIIFRPGILPGEADRGETRVMESIATSVLWLASKVSSSVYMPVPTSHPRRGHAHRKRGRVLRPPSRYCAEGRQPEGPL
ncbi:uncharacterized protein LAESUDRAFT_536289 [Laetiporus sulphureus 93-53]|uniref:NAD(P)-binding domain-containing protein n=1 Tax=Laetiporus sulphureus 93-53 TaxID=1314785 RepID=A0A165B9Z9_9APHY|nr:uncharacterized protein LAESUDRAFT_536289 [Laetiporus sulphureus 93-53]KZT00592.1 hypothetical protein LAESUDRAFT_536289 [Laetiporus sulphureus 93-53]